MRFEIFNPYPNLTVAKRYVAFIEEQLYERCDDIKVVEKLGFRFREKCGVVVVAAEDAIKAKIRGYSTIILWTQGIIPEESYMRNNSKLRFLILSRVEKMGLRCASACIFISNAMKAHYSRKYGFEAKHFYVMPCFNSEMTPGSFEYPNKYSNNLFIYAGGLQPWQCFDITMELFSLIEKKVPNAELRVLTKDKDSAEKVIKEYGIKNYSISYVDPTGMVDELSKAKFGFSLREYNDVNRVATPTKLSTYVTNGVIPIYTSALEGFSEIAYRSDFCLEVNLNNLSESAEKIARICNQPLDALTVQEDFKKVFGQYYSESYHRENFAIFLNSLLKENPTNGN